MKITLLKTDLQAESMQVPDTPKIVLHHLETTNTTTVAVIFLQMNILLRPIVIMVATVADEVEITLNIHVEALTEL